MASAVATLVAEIADPKPARERNSAALVAAALEAALKARAPDLQASTGLVVKLAFRVGRELGLDAPTQSLLEVAARVRDIGMIGVPDHVLLETAPLSPSDWELINRHPVLGAQLLEEFSAVAEAAPIVHAHHERWDGNGYPDGLAGDQIPLLSRVIATCDAFVAIAGDRPHRSGMGAAAAIDLVRQESGTQFDPVIVDALVSALSDDARRRASPTVSPTINDARPRIAQSSVGPKDLKTAILEFDVVPVLAPAWERLSAVIASERSTGGDLVVAIETDIGLTVAVMRAAQALAVRRKPITSVPDAVDALGPERIADATRSIPRAEFLWRTSQVEVLLHGCLVHAQAVARAADRLARELELPARDEILVAALLHDIGKLVLGRAVLGYSDADEVSLTPEERIRTERASGMDHASLGGLLLRRWGLPEQLVSNVTRHHTAEDNEDVATYVRLADMLAHHAQGHAVDRAGMLALAHLCGLPTGGLREILFDLPHSGASIRRRAEPSPLSDRQTAVLALLGKGLHYKEIALELSVAASTVRSHAHATYTTLGVDDRAQAVLRATEMGWI
jgi:putative nucleotidyltransferase with HDIG domain